MSLAVRLQKLREEQHLSQEQLAEQLGVSRQAVSKWENEQANPDIENIIKLSKIFGVSNDYLLTGENAPNIETIHNPSKSNKNSPIPIIITIGATLLLLIAGIFYAYHKYF